MGCEVSPDLGDEIPLQGAAWRGCDADARFLRRICQGRDVVIVQGAVSPNHIRLLVSVPPQLAPAKLVQYLKGPDAVCSYGAVFDAWGCWHEEETQARIERSSSGRGPHLKSEIGGTRLHIKSTGNSLVYAPLFTLSEIDRVVGITREALDVAKGRK